MEVWIIVVPIWILALAALVGGSALVEIVNTAEEWIQQHCTLICVIVIAIYVLIVWLEFRGLKDELKKQNTYIPLFVICSILRAIASAAYVVFLVVGIAATFRVSYSIWENIEEVFGLVLMSIPIFSFSIFEKVLELETSNGSVVVGCILSILGSFLGVAVFMWDFLPTIFAYMFG